MSAVTNSRHKESTQNLVVLCLASSCNNTETLLSNYMVEVGPGGCRGRKGRYSRQLVALPWLGLCRLEKLSGLHRALALIGNLFLGHLWVFFTPALL